jgi:AmmeMemoRadiSam system protein B/AmmeMemoRadiSam system protein A
MRTGTIVVVGLTLAACLESPGRATPPDQTIRPSAVAGQFYPSDAGKLKAAVDGFLRDAPQPRVTDVVAIVVPHAGYVFSGQIAADAYRQVAGQSIDTVVILGVNHTGSGANRISVFDGAGYQTPLGVAAVDRDLATAIVGAGAGAVFDSAAHASEHSIEVQVPFVQQVFPKAKIVPIVVGVTDPGTCARFGRALGKTLTGRRVLLVASSDLSHYPPQSDAVMTDARTLEAIASLEPDGLSAAVSRAEQAGVRNLMTCACGEAPIRVAMEAARALGANRGTVVSYANSGDTLPGDRDRVVGYGSVVFSRGEQGTDTAVLVRPPAETSGSLDVADKRVLLRLARDTITRYLMADMLPLPRGGSPKLLRTAGTFVTLKAHGDLRGCIGRIDGEGTLVRLVSAMAYESAFDDPRFPKLRTDELRDIEVEVSVLTPMKQVSGPEAIVVGRDGVVLRAGGRSAVFLPQVATEQGWTREQMLDQLALKAGLSERAWRNKTATFLTFQADVFSEATIR